MIFTRLAPLTLLATCVSIAAFGIGRFAFAPLTARESPRQEATAPQGQTWVALIADVRTLDHGREIKEKYYRNSYGSVRLEAYSPFSDGVLVTIHNLEQRMSYSRSGDGRWASLPLLRTMPLSPQTEPPVASSDVVSKDILGGRQVILVTKPENSRSWSAPDLNYLVIKSDQENGMRIREFLNIQLTEPDSALFAPPAGTTVRVASSIKDLLHGPLEKK